MNITNDTSPLNNWGRKTWQCNPKLIFFCQCLSLSGFMETLCKAGIDALGKWDGFNRDFICIKVFISMTPVIVSSRYFLGSSNIAGRVGGCCAHHTHTHTPLIGVGQKALVAVLTGTFNLPVYCFKLVKTGAYGDVMFSHLFWFYCLSLETWKWMEMRMPGSFYSSRYQISECQYVANSMKNLYVIVEILLIFDLRLWAISSRCILHHC